MVRWVIGAARRSSAARRERSQLGYRLRQVLRTRQGQPLKNPPIGGLNVILFLPAAKPTGLWVLGIVIVVVILVLVVVVDTFEILLLES